MLAEYLTYASMSALVAGLPGPSNFIAAKNGAAAGLRKSSIAITGHMSAVLLLALLSAVGLSSLIIAAPMLFNGIKLLGAGYLIFLGSKIIIGTLKQNQSSVQSEEAFTATRIYKRRLWREHFLVALGNPKALMFFTSLFPQFINVDNGLTLQILPLLCISLSSAFFFPFSYAVMGKNAAKLPISAAFKRSIQLMIGCAFIGFSCSLLFA